MKKHNVLLSAIALTLIACASQSNSHISDLTSTHSTIIDKKEIHIAESSLRTHKDMPTEEGIFLSSQEKFNFYAFSSGFYPKVGSDDEHKYYSFITGDGKNPIGELGSAKKAPLVDRIKSIAVPKNNPDKFCVVTFYNFQRCTKSIEFKTKNRTNS